MSFIYPLTMPASPAPSKIPTFKLQFNQGLTEGFDKSIQVTDWMAPQWAVQLQMPPMTRAQAVEWECFLLELDGFNGTFLFGPYTNDAPRGNWKNDSPLVKGASQTGNTLLIDGLTTSQSGHIKKGDWFQIGSDASTRLFKQLRDADTNSSGEATLICQPLIQTAPADNAAVVVNNPKGLFRLSTPMAQWSVDVLTRGFTLDILSVV